MRITAIYAALGALLVLVLAIRVSLYRRRHRIGIGDHGDRDLVRRIRAHANAVEYLPLSLLLLLLLELDQTLPSLLHLFGIVLILARVLHAIGLNRAAGLSPERAIGMVGTWAVMLVMALLLLWQALTMALI
ncbi:MAG TPA: MAPEG family protein [Rhodanobacteraceae bacterium]|nr:MAPEG family protein [Rhodanobacteraceae bacterium]